MYYISKVDFFPQLGDGRDTVVFIRRSHTTNPDHYRLSLDCLTYSHNPAVLLNKLGTAPDGLPLQVSEEPELYINIENLHQTLISKDWVANSKLILDYTTWLQQPL